MSSSIIDEDINGRRWQNSNTCGFCQPGRRVSQYAKRIFKVFYIFTFPNKNSRIPEAFGIVSII